MSWRHLEEVRALLVARELAAQVELLERWHEAHDGSVAIGAERATAVRAADATVTSLRRRKAR